MLNPEFNRYTDNMLLKTIIVEDEPLSLAFLNNLLKEFFPEITIIAKEVTATGAVAAINELKPDLVFLDIELRTGTGFDVLQQTRNIPFNVIFTTALDHLAINMIRICGVDYLQKPIDISGLKEVMQSVLSRNAEQTRAALDHLVYALAHNNRPSHIALSPAEYGYLAIEDIISIEMKDESTLFNLHSGVTAKSLKKLKEYELLLAGHRFFRSHQHYLVNIKAIQKVVLQPECLLVMSDGSRLPLSLKKVEALNTLLEDKARLH
jgi:two-component system LytT family response regulator